MTREGSNVELANGLKIRAARGPTLFQIRKTSCKMVSEVVFSLLNDAALTVVIDREAIYV